MDGEILPHENGDSVAFFCLILAIPRQRYTAGRRAAPSSGPCEAPTAGWYGRPSPTYNIQVLAPC